MKESEHRNYKAYLKLINHQNNFITMQTNKIIIWILIIQIIMFYLNLF